MLDRKTFAEREIMQVLRRITTPSEIVCDMTKWKKETKKKKARREEHPKQVKWIFYGGKRWGRLGGIRKGPNIAHYPYGRV